jgi:beta-lactamase regulating signal transducer with metallopeptidase domain
MAWWLFQNIVITAALAAVVALICRITRVGPVIRHALWVLVLVKFVTPPLVAWPWAAPDPFGIASVSITAADSAAMHAMPTAAIEDDGARAAAVLRRDTDRAVSPAGSLAELEASVWPWLFGIWIVGTAGLLALESMRLARLARLVRQAQPAPPALQLRANALADRLGMPRVPVLMMAGSTSPVIWCVGRPRLLWPADLSADSSDACIDGLLVHELAHVKRRDHLVGWLELAAGVVWWWNPLFWFVRSAMREQAELACDAWVISALPDGRRAYAESLLVLSGATAGRASSTSMAAVVGVRAASRRMLERRLVMIMKGRAPLRLSRAGLVTLAAMAIATLPTWAAGPQQPATTGTVAQAATAAQTAQKPKPATTTKAEPATKAAAAHPVEHPRETYPVHVQPPHAAAQVVRETRATTAHAAQQREVPVRAHVEVAPRAAQTRQAEVRAVPVIRDARMTVHLVAKLPDDGDKLLKAFEADRAAIRSEADAKIAAKHMALVKALQDLQEAYTKAGKLDEAVAIRDYLRNGGPDRGAVWIRR